MKEQLGGESRSTFVRLPMFAFEKESFMKKFLSIIMAIVALFSTTMPAYAAEVTNHELEQMSVSEALSDPEIVNYLISTDELDDFYQAQEEVRDCQYATTATYAREALGTNNISATEVNILTDKFDLQLPLENSEGLIDNGTINIQRNVLGNIIDIWYLYYTVSSSSFSVKAAMIDADNPLDTISGTITRYYLSNTTWTEKDDKTFSKSAVTNGTVYTWYVSKWGVKEKFEYDIKVIDNGGTHNFDNENEDNFTRYNFEAKPYNSFTANGGQRHHFIPATSLRNNGFDSNTAYCIRMMTADHKKTGSYGSSTYVSAMSNLLSSGKYQDALQKEVDDLQSKYDCEGIAGNLQQKYYDEVIICLVQYEALFGIS